MRAARIAVTVQLLLGLAAPAVAPFVGTALRPAAWLAWRDAGRIGELVLNTAVLAAGANFVAVPVGTVGGVLLSRVPFIGRRLAVGVIALGLFVPLPVYAVAWQVILSGWIPSTALAPGEVAWRPWAQGLVPAAWVHGTAAVPWVVVIVAAGLATADRGLEEDALVTGGSKEVFRRVLLPRVLPAAATAAVWVAVQCATEITVTDAMMVRTLAEEAYTQLAVGYAVGAAAAAAVTLPFLLVAIVIAVSLVRRVERYLPGATGGGERPVAIAYSSRVRTAVAISVWGLVMVFAGLPVAAIAWKAAGGGTPGGADVGRLVETLGRLARSDGWVLGESLLTAAAAGIITAALAWLACGLALRSRWFAGFLLVLCIVLWLTPGPLIGFGFKNVFSGLMAVEDGVVRWSGLRPSVLPIRSLVYDQPSPVPVVWAAVARLFPLAVAVTWPAVRAVPKDLLDLAAVDGLGVASFFRRVLTPVAGRAVPVAAVAVAALALGEVSAGKVVAPPGYRAFVLDLFAQMHYGTDATVCGICLMQLAATAVGLGCVWLVWVNTSRRMTNIFPTPDPSRFVETE
jgi:iron(III) transport system permease protein